MERRIKVRAEANPYHPDWIESFRKRRVFARRSHLIGNPGGLAGAGA